MYCFHSSDGVYTLSCSEDFSLSSKPVMSSKSTIYLAQHFLWWGPHRSIYAKSDIVNSSGDSEQGWPLLDPPFATSPCKAPWKYLWLWRWTHAHFLRPVIQSLCSCTNLLVSEPSWSPWFFCSSLGVAIANYLGKNARYEPGLFFLLIFSKVWNNILDGNDFEIICNFFKLTCVFVQRKNNCRGNWTKDVEDGPDGGWKKRWRSEGGLGESCWERWRQMIVATPEQDLS